MTKKIFQSILLVAGCVLLASLLIIMGFLYDYFGGVLCFPGRQAFYRPRRMSRSNRL